MQHSEEQPGAWAPGGLAIRRTGRRVDSPSGASAPEQAPTLILRQMFTHEMSRARKDNTEPSSLFLARDSVIVKPVRYRENGDYNSHSRTA